MAISSLQAGKTLAQLSDWKLNPLQMQKILYLANLYHIGHFDEPLIKECFIAREIGPTESHLYNKTMVFGVRPVGNVFRSIPNLETQTREYETLEKALLVLGSKSHELLVQLTQKPYGGWAKRCAENFPDNVIMNSDLKKEFDLLAREPVSN